MSDDRLSPEEYLQKLEARIQEEQQQEANPEEYVVEETAPVKTEKAKSGNKSGKKKRKKKHYFLRFIICVAIIAGVIYALQSSLFYVTDIEVTGNQFYTKAQIIEMSGLETGKNLFFEVKTKPARDALLSTPYIRVAKLTKVPRGTIKIELTERVEYAAIPSEEGFVLIDKEGMVLSVSEKQPQLPLLEGMNIITMEPGKPLAIEQSYLLTDTLALLNAVDETDLYFSRVYFSTIIVRAYVNDNYYCEGTPSEISNSLSDIRALMADQYSKGINKGVIRVGTDGYFSFSPKID